MSVLPVLGYWKSRGLAHAIRMLLHYKEVEFEDKMYEQGPAPEHSREAWLNDKFLLNLELPNLPYYIDDDFRITETSAIFAHLGRKYDLCGRTEEARIRNDMTYSFTLDNRMAMVRILYDPDYEKLIGAFDEGLPARVESFAKWLGDNPFFGGSELVYSDFCVYDLLDVWRVYYPECLEKDENLRDFMTRIEELPTVKRYMETKDYMKRGPFNGANAAWGGDVVKEPQAE